MAAEGGVSRVNIIKTSFTIFFSLRTGWSWMGAGSSYQVSMFGKFYKLSVCPPSSYLCLQTFKMAIKLLLNTQYIGIFGNCMFNLSFLFSWRPFKERCFAVKQPLETWILFQTHWKVTSLTMVLEIEPQKDLGNMTWFWSRVVVGGVHGGWPVSPCLPVMAPIYPFQLAPLLYTVAALHLRRGEGGTCTRHHS